MKNKTYINGKMHVNTDGNISFINRNLAWEYFEAKGYKREGNVLHHIDVTMKEKDYKRYIQWNISDLTPMSIQEHRRLHMTMQNPKGCKFSRKHKKAIKEGMKTAIRGKVIKIHRDAIKEDTKTFATMAEAAKYIGCTRQLVSQCLSGCQANKRAMGYEITIEER